VINPPVYAEASTGFEKIEDLDEAIPTAHFDREALPYEAGFVAGKAFLAYRQRGGERRSPLADLAPLATGRSVSATSCSDGRQSRRARPIAENPTGRLEEAGAPGTSPHYRRSENLLLEPPVRAGTLPDMSSPEQLTRRVDRSEEDLRAVADTVIEIRDTQREHGRKLDTIEDRLSALETQVTEGFVEILRRLDTR